jgi:hypothetical protein
MPIINGPITFKKGKMINREFKDAIRNSLGFKAISKEEAKKNFEAFGLEESK